MDEETDRESSSRSSRRSRLDAAPVSAGDRVWRGAAVGRVRGRGQHAGSRVDVHGLSTAHRTIDISGTRRRVLVSSAGRRRFCWSRMRTTCARSRGVCSSRRDTRCSKPRTPPTRHGVRSLAGCDRDAGVGCRHAGTQRARAQSDPEGPRATAPYAVRAKKSPSSASKRAQRRRSASAARKTKSGWRRTTPSWLA
jgi:hypothetical protein